MKLKVRYENSITILKMFHAVLLKFTVTVYEKLFS